MYSLDIKASNSYKKILRNIIQKQKSIVSLSLTLGLNSIDFDQAKIIRTLRSY